MRVVRSQSAFGFSMIYVVFEDDVDLYFARGARARAPEPGHQERCPQGVTPTLGPDATGVGHVFWYTVESPTHSLRDLRTLQDWFIRYQLNAVPGVAEVASVGGHVQQYQIDVDPEPPSRVRPAARRGRRRRARQQPQRRRQRPRVERRLVDRARRRPDRVGRRRRRRSSSARPAACRSTSSRWPTCSIGNAFRVASLVKGTHEAVGGVVVARTGVNTQGGDRRASRRASPRSSPGCRRA